MTPAIIAALVAVENAVAALRVLLTKGDTPPAVGAVLTVGDIAEAAQALGVTEAVVYAVRDVESAGKGFAPDGRPIILFEPHIFSKYSGHRFDSTHGGVSYPKWGTKPYPKTQAQRWGQLDYAMNLDREAALKAASWGLFQIMGFNYAAAGFQTVEAFVEAMKRSERDHLMAFVSFVKVNRLDDELRALDWAGFARGYNGPGYAANKYDEKLAAAYAKWSKA